MIQKTVMFSFLWSQCLVFGAWAEDGSGDWDRGIRITRNPAISRTSINFQRSLAADDRGRVYLVWEDHRDGNSEIYFKRSPNSGAAWGPAVRLTVDPRTSRYPTIALSGDVVHVVWFEESSDAPAQLFHRRSPDGGLSWEPARRLTASPGGAAFPSLAASGRNLHLVYVDGRHGHSEVYYLRSRDGSGTWDRERRLSELPHNSWTPTVAAWKENVYVAWTDTRHGPPRDGEEEYFKRSHNDGTSWSADQRLTFDPANSWAPSLAAAGTSVWLTWFDERDGHFEIYFKHSPDSGRNWSEDRRLTFGRSASLRPSIVRAGSSLYIVWWNENEDRSRVLVKRSPDLGMNWGPDVSLSNQTSTALLPHVAASSRGIFAAWTDGRQGHAEIVFRRKPGALVLPGNGRIAFPRFVDGAPQIFTVAPDGRDEKQLTFRGQNQYPAWSKDGTRIAFSSDRTDAFEIWIMNGDGSEKRQLTFATPGGNFVPDWSFDGTRIAFASTRDGLPDVWVMGSDGSDPKRLTATPPNPGGFAWSLHPSWSPDDAHLVYASTRAGSSQIWKMLADGRSKRPVTAGLGPGYPHANVPEWSHDGRWITFWAGFEGQFGEVWRMRPDGSEARRLTETPDPKNSDNPAFSPDGSRLLFDSNRLDPAIWVVKTDGTGSMPMIHHAAGQTSWQPVFLPVPIEPQTR